MVKRLLHPVPGEPQRNTGSKVTAANIVFSVGLSLVVLGLIATFTIEPDSLALLVRMQWWMPLAAFLSVALRVFLGAWRLRFIDQDGLSWMGALRAQVAWDFFSNVTPSAVGGGPLAAAYIAQDSNIKLGDATAMMLFAMLMDQIWFAAAIVIVLVTSPFMALIPPSLGTAGDVTFSVYFVLFLIWVCLFAYATLVRPKVLTSLVDFVFRVPWLRRFHPEARGIMSRQRKRAVILRTQQPLFYLKSFALTILIWLCRYALVVIVLIGLHSAVDPLLATFRSVVMMLGALVMPTPGGAGGVEGLFALMLGPLIPAALLAPALLVWRLLGYYVFIALGAFLTVHQFQRTLQARASTSG